MTTLLDDYRIQIMNQIIGFNPTGQLKLNSDGTIKFMGNISQIYTPQSLQASQLGKISNNEVVNKPQSVTVAENFTNFGNEKDTKIDIKKVFYVLLVVIFFLIIYLNIKKI